MRLRSMLILMAALSVCACERDDGKKDGGPTPRMDSGPVDGNENTVAACTDEIDNDGNGFIDCDDFGCCAVVTCGADTSCGMRPDAGMNPNVACDGPSEPENTPALCSDGCNNDHADDNFGDCNDFDCCEHRTDCPANTACGMRGGGACPGDPVPENTLTACTNGCSDDHDDNTFVDCEDFGCCAVIAAAVARGVPGVEACAATSTCGRNPPAGMICDTDTDLDAPPERENSFERCSDECSNTRHGRHFDCQNYNCCAIIERAVAEGVEGAVACGATTSCGDGSWTPRPGVELCAGDDGTGDPPEENTPELCSNDCDDDRNGFQDCDERACCGVRTDCPTGTYCGDRA